MRLPFLVICLAAFWIFSAAAAEDKYTFGPVPSPSKFSTDVSLPPAKIEPAKPVVAPTNSVEPAKPIFQPVAAPANSTEPATPIFQPVEAKAESAPSNFKPVEPAVQRILPKVEPAKPVVAPTNSVEPATPIFQPVAAPTNSAKPATPIFQPVEAKAESAPSNFKPVEPAVQPILPKVEPVKPPRASGKLIVEAGGGLDGKVVVVDAQRYFVVLNFPLGQMPPVNAALNVYRHGVKVGELSVTGPQRDDSIVADIVSGELQVGDSARDR